MFHPELSTNDKAKFAFDLYDVNGNGVITREELKQLVSAVMKRSIFLNLDEEAIDQCWIPRSNKWTSKKTEAYRTRSFIGW